MKMAHPVTPDTQKGNAENEENLVQQPIGDEGERGSRSERKHQRTSAKMKDEAQTQEPHSEYFGGSRRILQEEFMEETLSAVMFQRTDLLFHAPLPFLFQRL
ncbi:MAG: hypothetical protein ACSW8H_10370 [bacterium]